MAVCVGCGLVVNGDSGLLEVEVDPAGGITCSDSGLAVSGAAPAAISPDACNGITLHSGKLYSPCPATIAGIHDDVSGAINDVIAGPNDLYNYESATTATITNTLCCSVIGTWTITAGGLYTQDLVDEFLTIAHLEISVNGGGYAPVFPFASRRYNNIGDGAVANTDFDNLAASDTITLAPSASITLRPRIQINVQGPATNAGHVIGVAGFRTQWHLTQTGCC